MGLGFGLSFFFLFQSQIAAWSLKRMRHLCKRTAHGIYRRRREKLARIPYNHIQTNTPFAVDQHQRSFSVLGTVGKDYILSEFIKNHVMHVPKEL